jgi:hypothetical protein
MGYAYLFHMYFTILMLFFQDTLSHLLRKYMDLGEYQLSTSAAPCLERPAKEIERDKATGKNCCCFLFQK